MVKDGKAYRYASWCVEADNRKVGKYVKKQAAAWLEIADGKSEKAYVDEKRLEMIGNIFKLLPHPDLGRSLSDGTEDHASFLITAVLCTKSRENGKR